MGHGLLGKPQIGLQCVVDQGLITLSRLLGLHLEALKDSIIEIDSDARLSLPVRRRLPLDWVHRNDKSDKSAYVGRANVSHYTERDA